MELIETAVFTRQAVAEWSAEEHRAFQLYLVLNPESGAVIPGTGGLRKVRWRLPGRGKRGGARVIYYFKSAVGLIFLLFLYPKNVRSDLSPRELRVLRSFSRPTNRWTVRPIMRKDLFDQLLTSVQQMKEIEAGRRKPSRVTRAEDLLASEPPDVAALRAHFGLSQSKFAALLGISVDTLQNWEQRRRRPEGPAQVLLRVAAAHPEALLSVSRSAPARRRNRKAAV